MSTAVGRVHCELEVLLADRSLVAHDDICHWVLGGGS